jgi:hypothetical protein
MTGDRVLRPSSLTDYLDCPRRWAARHIRDDVAAAGYVLRPRSAASAGALVGSGLHAGAGWTLEQMRDAGTAGTDADAVEVAIGELRARADAEGADWDETTETMSVAERQVRRMTLTYRQELAPKIVPFEVEARLQADLAPGWVLSGQADLIAAERDASRTVRDTKSGTRARANGVQYGAYTLLWQAHGLTVSAIYEDYLKRVRLDREQPPPVTLVINVPQARMDAWETIQAVQRDAAEFQKRVEDPRGAPPPGAFRPNPASALCSARWCPAWGTSFCRSHR